MSDEMVFPSLLPMLAQWLSLVIITVSHCSEHNTAHCSLFTGDILWKWGTVDNRIERHILHEDRSIIN